MVEIMIRNIYLVGQLKSLHALGKKQDAIEEENEKKNDSAIKQRPGSPLTILLTFSFFVLISLCRPFKVKEHLNGPDLRRRALHGSDLLIHIFSLFSFSADSEIALMGFLFLLPSIKIDLGLFIKIFLQNDDIQLLSEDRLSAIG